MWLPSPIYEWLPTSYVAFGVLFIAGSLYIGLEAPMAPLYVGLGVVCILIGFLLQYKRSQHRGNSKRSSASDNKSPHAT